MNSTIFCERLEMLRQSGDYSDELLSQVESVALENDFKIPKSGFKLHNASRETISRLLYRLGYPNLNIYALNGSSSSEHLILPDI